MILQNCLDNIQLRLFSNYSFKRDSKQSLVTQREARDCFAKTLALFA